MGTRADVGEINRALRALGTPGAESLSAIAARVGLAKSSIHRHKGHVEPAPERLAERSGTAAKNRGTARGTTGKFAMANPADDPATAPRKVVAAAIEQECVDLRAKGKSYAEIAGVLGISEDTALDYVERVLIRTRRGTDAKADAARRLDLIRIDKLIAAVWDRATDPSMARVDVPADTETGVRAYDAQDKAIDRVTKLLAQRSKLLGLDAPVSVAVTLLDRAEAQPDFSELFRVMRRLLDARFPGATAFLDDGLEHYRVRGEPGVEAFLAGDMALPVAAVADGAEQKADGSSSPQ